MESCFAACSAFTRAEEGGYVDDPRDSGNWSSGRVGQGTLVGSNMGVGAPALLAWMGPGAQISAEQMRKLSPVTYEAIARCKYWMPLGCRFLPAGLDLMAFDFGWNRGVRTSLDLLARCLGLMHPAVASGCDADGAVTIGRTSEQLVRGLLGPEVRILQQSLGVSADGIAGPETVKALDARQDIRAMAAILTLSAAQIASYRQLVNFPIYGAGWLARSARRRAAALAAALQATSTASRPIMAA